MAAFDFPSSPTDGQQYTANGVTWTWSAAVGAWGGGPAAMPVASVAEFRAGSAAKLLDNSIVWSAAAEVTIAYVATWAPDMRTFVNAVMAVNGALLIDNPSFVIPGRSGAIHLTAAAAQTLTFGNQWYFNTGTKPTSVPIGESVLYYYIPAAGKVFCSFVGPYSNA